MSGAAYRSLTGLFGRSGGQRTYGQVLRCLFCNTAAMRVEILGGVAIDGRAVGGARLARLLAVLAATRNRPVSVDVLEEAVWGGEPQSKTSVHTAISRLRTRLGNDAVERVGTAYLLRLDGTACDADVFESCVESARHGSAGHALTMLDDAFALWRGRPFGDHGDSEFLTAEMARLSELHALAHVRRLEALVELGRFDDAVVAAESPLQQHPFHEGIQALRLRALAGSGRRVEAVRAAHHHRQFLLEETGLGPSSEIIELERALLDDPVAGPALSASSFVREATLVPPMPVGLNVRPVIEGARRTERSALHSLLSEALQGVCVFCLVEGEPGSGKTTIVEELRDEARRVGARAVTGAALAGVRLPLQIWRAVTTVLPDQLTGDGATTRNELISGVVDALRSDDRPLVVILEDLHWADDLSLDALAAVCLEVVGTARPLLVVATTRPDRSPGSSAALARLRRVGSTRRIVLGPLDTADVEYVLRAAVGERPSRQLVGQIEASTGGNPLLIRVTAQSLLAKKALHVSADGLVASGVVAASLPGDVQAPYREAIERLGASTQDVLKTLALLGDRVELALLAAVVGLPIADVLLGLGEAEEGGLATVVGERAQFDHDLARRAVMAVLTGGERQVRHARIAESLRRHTTTNSDVTDEHIELIATQFENAGVLTDTPSITEWSARAGEVAARSTLWPEAARHLRAVRSRVDLPGLDLRLGYLQFMSLDPMGRESFGRALEAAKNSGDVDSWTAAVLGLYRQSVNLGIGVESARVEMLAALDGAPGAERTRRLAILAQLAEFAGETKDQDGSRWRTEALCLLRTDDDPGIRRSVLFGAGLVHLWELDLDTSERMFVECAIVGPENLLGPSETRLAHIYLLRGDGARALEMLSEHLEMQLRGLRYWSELGLLLATKASAHALLGNGAAARQLAEDATRWSELGGSAGWGLFGRSLLHFTRWMWPTASAESSDPSDDLGALAGLMALVDPRTWTMLPSAHSAARAVLENHRGRQEIPNFGSLGTLWRSAILAIAVGDASLRQSLRASIVELGSRGVVAAPAVPLRADELCRLLVPDVN